MAGVLLWENPNPTVSFAAQTIVFDHDYYDVLEIYYKSQTTSKTLLISKTLKGYDTAISTSGGTSSSGPVNATRTFQYLSPVTYAFNNCMRYYSGQEVQGNAFVIPVKIIGYKS